MTKTSKLCIRFLKSEVLTAMTLKIIVFWDLFYFIYSHFNTKVYCVRFKCLMAVTMNIIWPYGMWFHVVWYKCAFVIFKGFHYVRIQFSWKRLCTSLPSVMWHHTQWHSLIFWCLLQAKQWLPRQKLPTLKSHKLFFGFPFIYLNNLKC
jgi:hypothetical protein